VPPDPKDKDPTDEAEGCCVSHQRLPSNFEEKDHNNSLLIGYEADGSCFAIDFADGRHGGPKPAVAT